jgi:putative ABC transport system ATP-binding protein
MALFDTLHEEGQTVIIVTHEPDIAAHCQRVVRLADGKVQSDTVNAHRTRFNKRELAGV